MIQLRSLPRLRSAFEETFPDPLQDYPSMIPTHRDTDHRRHRVDEEHLDDDRSLPVSPSESVVEAPVILVIDDEPSFVRLMDILLTSNNYVVVPCPAAAQATALARQHQPQLILLDLHLPLIDNGRWPLERLRRDPRTQDIPIIVTSADPRGLQKYAEELERNSIAQLMKPFDLEHLLAVIRRTLGPSPETGNGRAQADNLRANTRDDTA